MKEALPELRLGTSTIVVHLNASKEANSNPSALQPYSLIQQNKLKLSENEVLSFCNKLDIKSEFEQWRFSFSVEPSWGNNDQYFISTNTIFEPESPVDTMKRKNELIYSKIKACLQSIDMEIQK